MRPVKLALAAALASDNTVTALVPPAQIFPVERATLPTLPAVEVIGLSSERVGDGPMVVHELISRGHGESRDRGRGRRAARRAVRAVRQRIGAAERSDAPITQEGGEACLCVLGATRWSISASAASSVIRGRGDLTARPGQRIGGPVRPRAGP